MLGFQRRSLGTLRLLISFLLLAAWEAGSGQLHYSIPQEAKHGTFVGRMAQDLGLELEELVPRLFRVEAKGRGVLLEVNLHNGILFVNSQIDREELCGRSVECSIHLEVIVDRPLQVFHVEVEVKDINDNPPTFSLREQSLLIFESKQPDSRFPLEGASDADIGENALLTYRLSQNEYFALESPTNSKPTKRLSLILKKSLDREKTPKLNLLLTATDGGKPELTGTLQLLVCILDVNDNDLEFDQLEYKVRMMENIAKETLLIKLNATDEEGVNGEVTYFLMSIKPNGKLLFTLDENNGEVRVNGTLHYEENKFYEIEVQATDKGNPPMAGHCTVWVEIVDTNDNAPEITVTSLSLPVREDTQPTTVIALISVSDRDPGVNGQVTCSLTPDVPFKIVSTFKNYYSLVLDSDLDREKVSAYNLVVTARDGGSPSLWTTATVSVEVADVKDNAPAFPQSEYTIFVKENNLPGSHNFTVSAGDADSYSGYNAWLSYQLLPAAGGARSPFRVGLYTGEISTTRALDETDAPRQRLLVLDHGEPVLMATARVLLSLVESRQAPKAASPMFASSAGQAEALVDVNVYLIIAICAVSSLLVLTLLLYTALRCSAGPTENACGPGKPTLVCSSAVGSWSYSQQRRQRVCSGEDPPKTDLMAFSHSLPPGLDREDEKGRQEAGSNNPIHFSFYSWHPGKGEPVSFMGPMTLDLGLFWVVSKDCEDLLAVNLQNGILFVNSRIDWEELWIDWEELCRWSAECSIHLEVIVDRPLQVFIVEVEVKDINDNPPVLRQKQHKDCSDWNNHPECDANAPEFDKPAYKAALFENVRNNTRIIQLNALDMDEGLNGEISCEIRMILPVSENCKFSINPGTGEIRIHRELDFEENNAYEIQVNAIEKGFLQLPWTISAYKVVVTTRDESSPSLWVTTRVFVKVAEVNNNAPTFAQLEYKMLVKENNPPAADAQENARLSYSLVKAQDSRVPLLGSKVTLQVFELNENDNARSLWKSGAGIPGGTISMNPYARIMLLSLQRDPGARYLLFSLLLLRDWEAWSGQLHYSVPEEAKHGTFVGRIAQDLVLEITELVPRLFWVASKDRGDLLEVNLKNGILFVNSRIDREELCGQSAECSIHLVIVDRLLQVFHVEVEVKDINDNPPVFPENNKSIMIAESRPPETRFPLDGASDADIGANAALTYRLDPNDYFTLDTQNNREQTSSLSLVLRKTLDREAIQEHSLLLTASDGGKPELTGTVQLLIIILDVNDNAPEFDQFVYKVKVLENALNGTLLIKLNATDPDEGINGDIVYSFRRPVSPSVVYAFSINSNDGEVRTKGKLDFEEKKLYEISVEAVDKGNIPMTGHCTLLVEVLDINDNAPEVTITTLSLPNREDTQPSAVIALISVSHRDSGANGQVTCFLTPHVPFKLVPTFKNYYSLVLDSVLDPETISDYKLVVTARDGGSPSLSATASMSVEVADVNDNAPAFTQTEYTVFVKENNPPGFHIFTVSAPDADARENVLVSYSLVERLVGQRELSSYVSVHAGSGKVYVLQPLDHEELELLQFQVTAHNAGSSNLMLQVFVLDENDNAPTLLPPRAGGCMSELVPLSVDVGQVVAKVRAVDADSGYNAWLSYELQTLVGSVRSPFCVGLYTGEISITHALDEVDAPRLLVLVKDPGEPALTATATVLVSLVESGQVSNVSSRSSTSASGPEVALVDVNVYPIIAICAVSSLLVLTLVLYMAFRCSAVPTEGACGRGKPTLVCSSAVGSWSYSQQRRQRVCSGEVPAKTDLMAFSPGLSPVLGSAEETCQGEGQAEFLKAYRK
ncbi:LOW QUALITY PROTEIN: uncharacterized protein ACOB7L_007965 [Callospermophilus lateralis]